MDEVLVRWDRVWEGVINLVSAVWYDGVFWVTNCFIEVGFIFIDYYGELLYLFSALYLVQYVLEEEVVEVCVCVLSEGLEVVQFLGRLLIGLGWYVEAILWFEKVVVGCNVVGRVVVFVHFVIGWFFFGGDACSLVEEVLEVNSCSMVVFIFSVVIWVWEVGRVDGMWEVVFVVSDMLDFFEWSC